MVAKISYIADVTTKSRDENTHWQYPTPVYDEGLDRLSLYVTGRNNNNQSIANYYPDVQIDKWYSPYLIKDLIPFGPIGSPYDGGVSIQHVSVKRANIKSSNYYETVHQCLFTGYSAGSQARYRTWIFSQSLIMDNVLRPTPKNDTNPVIIYDGKEELISACTPCQFDGILFYNSHQKWIKSEKVAGYYEPTYIAKARQDRDTWEVIPPLYNQSYTRPWVFEFKKEKYLLLSVRWNQNYREEGYHTRLYRWTLGGWKELSLHWEDGRPEGMEAYTTAIVIDNRCFVFYNSAFNSPVHVGELTID